MKAHQWGAVAYGAWGTIHAALGGLALSDMTGGWPAKAVRLLADRSSPRAADTLDPSVAALLTQHSYDLLTAGCAAITFSILNWRNNPAAYWGNLLLVGLMDLGFVSFVVLPGHASLAVSLAGPLLWLAGALLTTVGGRGAVVHRVTNPVRRRDVAA